jgi:hypothetical protein
MSGERLRSKKKSIVRKRVTLKIAQHLCQKKRSQVAKQLRLYNSVAFKHEPDDRIQTEDNGFCSIAISTASIKQIDIKR